MSRKFVPLALVLGLILAACQTADKSDEAHAPLLNQLEEKGDNLVNQLRYLNMLRRKGELTIYEYHSLSKEVKNRYYAAQEIKQKAITQDLLEEPYFVKLNLVNQLRHLERMKLNGVLTSAQYFDLSEELKNRAYSK